MNKNRKPENKHEPESQPEFGSENTDRMWLIRERD